MTENADTGTSRIGRRRAAAIGGTSTTYHDRRGEIIAAAVTLFRERGYRKTSLADIAGAVGADRASIYYYFSSKEELLSEVVTPIVVRDAAAAEAIRDSAEPAPAKIRRVISNMMRSYAEHYPLPYLYLQEDPSRTADDRQAWAQQMRAVSRRYEAAVETIIKDGIAARTLRSRADPQVLAYGLMGMVSWTYRWYNPRQSPVDAESIGQAYADVILHGMVVAEAGCQDGRYNATKDARD